MDISKLAPAKSMVMYICAAAVLHNLLLGMSDTSDWDEALYDLDESNREDKEGGAGSSYGYDDPSQRRNYHCEKFAHE